ncbi:DUF6976 family protein [Marinibactrum halimedae]|uniref:Uncharacterized protein n=1 Tax=Marinibactrum halimedae TaxID=1444977 RepID=A0AA37WKK0_9GAMM|nr:hypothetical protein [Marinibactrum halimedae]MCD9458119.1 hypothetical protein [Marinibactrum halimedae]GLS25053.1 hypothetical protein GCM10007877_07670 [Marinibactrum halimedae]
MAIDKEVSFSNRLLDVDTVKESINNGDYLMIAADEKLLSQLPAGNWIAGTIPYFMGEEGGVVTQGKLFVTKIEGITSNQPPRLTLYDSNTISRIAQEAPEQGFSLVILPATSEVHINYAHNAPNFPNMFFSPIIGWIAGVHLDELGKSSAKTGFGPASGQLSEQHAVVMHVPLPEHQMASVNTVNLFQPGSGPSITFNETGFSVGDCKIDGKPANLAQYILENKIDTCLPLVADYSGVMVNVSVQNVNEVDNKVDLYAPVFADMSYRFAEPVGDYVSAFDKAMSSADDEKVAFSCNCILNFLYSELEGKKTQDLVGPITFGEVAYQLLNQTMVYLSVTND